MAYDFETGFGLVQPLGRLDVKPIARGSASALSPGDSVYVLGRGGRAHALEAELLAKREFAGYWEYVLDEALFATPLHPEWSGAALLDGEGKLVGIGSLYVQEEVGDEVIKGNMFVPIDLLDPIEEDLVSYGRARRPARPWLGMYTAEIGRQARRARAGEGRSGRRGGRAARRRRRRGRGGADRHAVRVLPQRLGARSGRCSTFRSRSRAARAPCPRSCSPATARISCASRRCSRAKTLRAIATTPPPFASAVAS